MFFCFCVAKVAQFCKQASCFRQKMHKNIFFVHFLSKTPSTAARQFTSLFLVYGQVLLDYSRNPGCHGVGRDIFRYHASSRYDAIVAYRNTGQYGNPGTEPYVVADFYGPCEFQPLVAGFSIERMSRCGKTAIRPDKHIVPEYHFRRIKYHQIMVCEKIVPYLDIVSVIAPQRWYDDRIFTGFAWRVVRTAYCSTVCTNPCRRPAPASNRDCSWHHTIRRQAFCLFRFSYLFVSMFNHRCRKPDAGRICGVPSRLWPALCCGAVRTRLFRETFPYASET